MKRHTLLNIVRVLSAMVGTAVAGSAAAQAAPASWTDTLEVSGDLRLRYEMIREDGSEDRNRARFRGRVGIAAELSPDVQAVFGLATGGDDPVSTNQSFGEGFTTKDIGLNLAYIKWTFHENWSLVGGKMKQPWFTPGGTPLVWDSDLNPEGLAVEFRNGKWFGSAGSFVVAERSSDSETMLNTVQAGFDWPLTADSALAASLAYFDYTNVIGQSPFYDDDAQGNTVDINNDYVFDYNEVELGLQYKTKFGNWPLVLFGDYVVNTEVSREDTAYTLGITVGQAKAPGTMQFSYAWQDTAADAVNATYNDSDFAGGLTDAKGHFIRARYALRDSIYFNLTLIVSEYGAFTGNAVDYNRAMLDVQFSF